MHNAVGGRASLSAPESLTRVHEDITSQVRVSGTERDASVSPAKLQNTCHTPRTIRFYSNVRGTKEAPCVWIAFQKSVRESNEDLKQQSMHADKTIDSHTRSTPNANFHD